MHDLAVLRDRLRRVTYPGFATDIVSAGFVRDIRIADGVATVFFAPNTTDESKVRAMIGDVRTALAGVDGVQAVDVKRLLPFQPEEIPEPQRAMTPLQGELLAAGVVPRPDLLGVAAARPELAPEIGYDEGGPAVDAPPIGPGDRYDGWPPVLQWEIDPTDPDLPSGEVSVTLGGWEYDVWWQLHPSELVYVSIQALRDDRRDRGPARAHPVGRNVVVNLVHDLRRRAVVAIYGTARDFRPFVEAFRVGFHLDRDRDGSRAPQMTAEVTP